MNSFDTKRNNGGWTRNHMAAWTEGNTAFISCVFSWDVPEAVRIAKHYKALGYHVRAGGPAVTMNPDPFYGIATLGGSIHALPRHNKQATFTSRGCIRKCPFCAVPKIEGDLVELEQWEPRPLICDNNLLACSLRHFDSVIDTLKAASIKGVDFNQGLDARLLTKHHAARIAELDLFRVRLAWDNVRLEGEFMNAWHTLRNAGIPKRTIGVYVLIGFNDTPDDAEYRLRTVYNLDSYPLPMRYQPVDAMIKNAYIADGWTDWQLTQFMRYWSNRRLGRIPFSQWLETYQHEIGVEQLSF